MLKQRVITGIILMATAIFLMMWATPIVFMGVMSFVVFLAGWEWCGLMQIERPIHRCFYLFIMSLAMIAVFHISAFYFLGIIFCWWSIASFFVLQYPKQKQLWNQGFLVRAMMGLLVLVPFWYSIIFIQSTMDGRWLLFFLIVLISGADVGAYFSGKTWGKKKILVNVSPNKTWVGLIGGILLAMSIALVSVLIFPQVLSMNASLVDVLMLLSVACVTVIFSVIGDFFESMLKREAGLKDSGAIFPGHGGILDRIDSWTAATPVFLFGLLLINLKI